MKILRIASIVLLAAIAFTGCKKEEETSAITTTTEEAASIMATSLCTANAGTITQVEDAVALAEPTLYKSSLYDSTFTISSLPDAIITYQYQMNYSFGFLNANTYQLVYSASGNCDSPAQVSTITSSGTIGVTGFVSGTSFVCNGDATSEGTFAMKIGNANSLTATVTTKITDFTASKETGQLLSGTAVMTVSGKTSNGATFGFTGTLVYEGNYTGTLTINNDKFYISLKTGTVSESNN